MCVRMADQNGAADHDTYTAKLTDPAAVAELLETVRLQHGPIVGLIHLLPLKAGTSSTELDLTGWQERNRPGGQESFLPCQGCRSRSQAGHGGWRGVADRGNGDGWEFRQRGSSQGSPSFQVRVLLPGLSRRWPWNGPACGARWSTLRRVHSPAALAEQLLAEIITAR